MQFVAGLRRLPSFFEYLLPPVQRRSSRRREEKERERDGRARRCARSED